MSDFSLTLVLQIKTSKIINDMPKVQQKSEKISAFGGLFFVLDKFDRILSSVIDSHLGLRSKLIGYVPSDYTLVWLKTDRHVSNGGKIRPLKNYLRIFGYFTFNVVNAGLIPKYCSEDLFDDFDCLAILELDNIYAVLVCFDTISLDIIQRGIIKGRDC